jgi:transcriptional regulator with XRE-family HTH domain
MSSRKKEPPFGDRIKEWRVRAGKTQAELDDAIGKRLGYTSQLEGGHIKKPPDRPTCQRIADALGMSKDEIWRHAARARLREFDPHLLEFHDEEVARADSGSAPRLSEDERSLLDTCQHFGSKAPVVTLAVSRVLDVAQAERSDLRARFETTAAQITKLDVDSIAAVLHVVEAVVGVFAKGAKR